MSVATGIRGTGRGLCAFFVDPQKAPGARGDWLLWLATRAFLIGIISGAIPWAEQVRDLDTYQRWVDQSLKFGQFPVDDMWQYPPLAGPIFVIGAWMPGQRLGFALLFGLFDAAVMLMIAYEASRLRRRAGRRLWALTPLIVGPLLLARFDVVATMFAVCALLLAATPVASGAVAAAGTWMKVWPALTILGLRRKDIPKGIAGALGATAVILAGLAATTRDPLSFLAGQRDRGLQIESVPAWPFLVAKAFGHPIQVIYRYGAHEVEASGTHTVAIVCTAVTAALMALIVVQRLRGKLEELPPADIALAAVLFTVVTSRVFSGQYFIWLIGIAAVCLSDPNTAMRTTTKLLIASGLATHLIYPWMYSALLEARPLAVFVQTVRIAAIIAATVAAVRVMRLPVGRHAQASGSRPSSRATSRSALCSQPQDDSTQERPA